MTVVRLPVCTSESGRRFFFLYPQRGLNLSELGVQAEICVPPPTPPEAVIVLETCREFPCADRGWDRASVNCVLSVASETSPAALVSVTGRCSWRTVSRHGPAPLRLWSRRSRFPSEEGEVGGRSLAECFRASAETADVDAFVPASPRLIVQQDVRARDAVRNVRRGV